ncbi:hypothetical protein ELI54_30930 (plasmid) [Rhizobium ruizarguesonis]|uniref:hypothetical protein n=1 Tax=Rhizobium ruizarguesonis TaxID=2081791 RepID=UPI0010305654|nr:hypothetical protein [Rhizobium ruizarguesonis]TAT72292.1 hypothetical protein ELI56_32140 [Rhizobium ruizarguesonis]TAT75935.1 hypothetical protein ELI54_30930 [Rhizobium ruizarguesonis]TAZ67603.1 hypothetical protein ELH70_28765 [Rhizobium ruizarguesonis]TAZ89191.1 hypothetical protein ELH69_34730 [Rhizobium ruizarguesonis]TBB80102.1 hypothetical protein ELH41_32485 [Rhizobium ruizarguesonis]
MDFALLFNLFRKPKQAKVADVTLWHKYETLLPVPLVDDAARNPSGQIWRRLNGVQWEYQQDPETIEEFDARQY